jgi:hypothetical protein
MGEWMYRSTCSWPRHQLEVSGQLHTPASLPPVPIGEEVGWTPEPVWTTWKREDSWPYLDSNSDPSVVQSVASRYTTTLSRLPMTMYTKSNIFCDVMPSSLVEIYQRFFRDEKILGVFKLRAVRSSETLENRYNSRDYLVFRFCPSSNILTNTFQ